MIYKRIKDVAVLLNGYAFKSKEYVESGIRVIRIANVQDGYISDEKPCFYPHSAVDEIDKYMLQEGDLLISLTGNVGRVGILTPEFIPAALNQRVSCIRIKPDSELDLSFLYYYLLRKQFVRDCIKASKGVAQLNLSTKWLENYLIPVPDLELQKRIVSHIEESLSQLDSAVETLKKTKQQLEVYRQAVLKEAFNNSRSNLKLSICDFAEVSTGATPLKSRADYYGGSIPWVTSTKVNDEYVYEPTDFITELAIKETNCRVFPPHTLLVAMYGEGKTRGKCSELMIPAATNQALAAILINKDSDVIKDYLKWFLIYNYGNIRLKSVGGVQPNINLSIIKKLEIPVFSKDVQKKIVRKIDSQMTYIEDIEQTVILSLQQSEALRQSILKQAFEED